MPVHDEIRQFKTAIDYVRTVAADRNIPVDLELIKQIYVILAPDEPEAKYRKDIPLHRHDNIVLEVGPYVPPHTRYRFPAGW